MIWQRTKEQGSDKSELMNAGLSAAAAAASP
jgi:hypothetical protein